MIAALFVQENGVYYARAAGVKPIKRLSRAENIATPIAFRDLLLSIAYRAGEETK